MKMTVKVVGLAKK